MSGPPDAGNGDARTLDVLVPTCDRPAALAVTLAGVVGQRRRPRQVVVSDQSAQPADADGTVQAVRRVLEAMGTPVRWHRHLPRRGVAEQRQFLLEQSDADYVCYLDDDLVLEPGVLDRLLRVIREERCGFVGAAFIGLSHRDDVRPHQQHLELWDGPVRAERITPDTPQWRRYELHNAANLWHVERRLAVDDARPLRYKVAWTPGCVLFDAGALREVGGFAFWRDLPEGHAGEDVLAQLRVMARFGGCGVLPSGVYHQELPTTVTDRSVDAHQLLDW